MKEDILGVKIDALGKKEALLKIEEFLKGASQHYLATVNPEFIVEARTNKEFQNILNQADLAVADGIAVVLASKILGGEIKERISGTDLIQDIGRNFSGIKIFLLGGQENIAKKAAQNLSKKYPQNQFDFLDGQDADREEMAIRKINHFSPDILLVAFGAPKQEIWIKRNLAVLPSVKLAIGVGGSFDLISGVIRRAPRLLRQIGLEWLWRLIQEPHRIKRIYRAVIVFPCLLLKNIIKHS